MLWAIPQLTSHDRPRDTIRPEGGPLDLGQVSGEPFFGDVTWPRSYTGFSPDVQNRGSDALFIRGLPLPPVGPSLLAYKRLSNPGRARYVWMQSSVTLPSTEGIDPLHNWLQKLLSPTW